MSPEFPMLLHLAQQATQLNLVMKYYKYRTTNNLEWLADILVNHRFYCSLPNLLNDPMEGLFHVNLKDQGLSTLQFSNENFKICSFSTDLTEILLWSHYAEEHKGIAIEFEPHKDLNEINYSDSLPTFTDKMLTAEEIHLTKLKRWAYEREYRYITKNMEEEFLYGKITKIIFGIRTPDSVKKIISV